MKKEMKKIRDPLGRDVRLVSQEQIDFIKERTDVYVEPGDDWSYLKLYPATTPVFFSDRSSFPTISFETFIQEFFPELQEHKMREFKVGDAVYDVLYQKYGVVAVNGDGVYDLYVRFGDGSAEWYTADGRVYEYHKIRTLYHEDEEPQQLRKPVKPLPTIKPGTIVEVWDEDTNGEKLLRYATGKFSKDGRYILVVEYLRDVEDGDEELYGRYRIIQEPSE